MTWDAYLWFKTAGILTFLLGGAFYAHKKVGFSLFKALFITFCAITLGFVLSRVWFILQYAFGSEPYDPATLAEAWNDAGSVLYGWILGGAVAIIILTRVFKFHTIKFFDAVLPWMLIAQVLNRFGCFAGECCWGAPTAFFISVWNQNAKALVHPVQLYEAVLDLALFAFIWKRAKRTGETTHLYFFGYSAGRFFLEFLRGDNNPALLSLTVPQVTALLVMLTVYLLWKRPSMKKVLAA